MAPPPGNVTPPRSTLPAQDVTDPNAKLDNKDKKKYVPIPRALDWTSPKSLRAHTFEQIKTYQEKWNVLAKDNAVLSTIAVGQGHLDTFGHGVLNLFEKLAKHFRAHSNPQDNETFIQVLGKLPFRAAYNFCKLLTSILEATARGIVHPVDSLFDLLRLIVNLTRPVNWSKYGAAALGINYAHAYMSGFPQSMTAQFWGRLFLVLGLTVGAMEAAYEDKKDKRFDAATENLFWQVKQAMQSFADGLFTGAVVGYAHKVNDAAAQPYVSHKTMDKLHVTPKQAPITLGWAETAATARKADKPSTTL